MDIYAPVVIPTLCRYSTFKRCLDSLLKCTGSQYTEVFIGLDYPAKESHWDGYNQISAYLETFQGFKSLHVIKREKNFGQKQNTQDLLLRVKDRFDRYIISEDDNEFSPNFLEYMNQGLEKYKDHPDVIAVCGFNYPFSYMNPIQGYKMNAFPIHAMTAWGCGFWTAKNHAHFVNSEKAREIIYSWKTVRSLWKLDMHATIHRLLFRYKRGYSDLMYHLYCIMEDKYVIFPSVSKVRNLGFEGNATNCRSNPIYANQKIDTEKHFEYDEFEIKNYPAIDAVHKRMFGRSFMVRRLCELEYLMFRMTGHVLRDFSFIRYFQRKNVNTNRT